MDLHTDIIKLICLSLSNKDIIALLTTCKNLNKLISSITYTEFIDLDKINHLKYINNFQSIIISCKSIKYFESTVVNPTKLIIMKCTFENPNKLMLMIKNFKRVTYLSIYNSHKCLLCLIFDYANLKINIDNIFILFDKLVELRTYFIPANDSLNKLSSRVEILKIFAGAENFYDNQICTTIPPSVKRLYLDGKIKLNPSNNITTLRVSNFSVNFNKEILAGSSLKKLSLETCRWCECNKIIKNTNIKHLKMRTDYESNHDTICYGVTHVKIKKYNIGGIQYYDSDNILRSINDIYNKYYRSAIHTITLERMMKFAMPSVHTLIIKFSVTQDYISTLLPTVKNLYIYVDLKNKITIPDTVEIIRTYVSNRLLVSASNLILYDYEKKMILKN